MAKFPIIITPTSSGVTRIMDALRPDNLDDEEIADLLDNLELIFKKLEINEKISGANYEKTERFYQRVLFVAERLSQDSMAAYCTVAAYLAAIVAARTANRGYPELSRNAYNTYHGILDQIEASEIQPELKLNITLWSGFFACRLLLQETPENIAIRERFSKDCSITMKTSPGMFIFGMPLFADCVEAHAGITPFLMNIFNTNIMNPELDWRLALKANLELISPLKPNSPMRVMAETNLLTLIDKRLLEGKIEDNEINDIYLALSGPNENPHVLRTVQGKLQKELPTNESRPMPAAWPNYMQMMVLKPSN